MTEAQAKKSKIHLVTTPNGPRLIRAVNRNQAIRHAARDLITARVATQDDMLEHIAAGVKVEDARADDEPVE